MQEKFEKLFYEFKPENKDMGSWTNGRTMGYFRGEKDIPGATMYTGFQIIYEPCKMEQEPIFHREVENLVFFGAGFPDVFSSFDAEIHFYMGPDLEHMEKVVITEPTIIKVPKNWPHTPLTFVRVDKPVFFQAVFFAGRPGSVKTVADASGKRQLLFSEEETHLNRYVYDASAPKSVPWTVINEDGVDSYSDTGAYDCMKSPSSRDTVIRPGYKSKAYSDATVLKAPKPALTAETEKCVLAMPKEETEWGDWCPSPQAYFRGDIYMEEAAYNVGFQVFTAANNMEDSHFHQGVDEYIFFVGANPENIFDFDARIEVFIGDDPDHMESKIITKPTVVRLPPTVWHSPILFRQMKKPLIFQAAFMHGTWGTITRMENKGAVEGFFNRDYVYSYMGDNVRFCKFDKTKRCNICGKCFPKQKIEE